MSAPNPSPDRSPVALQPGSTFHGYTVVRCIGIGGMGAVFEGVHDLLGRRCAIKMLHAKIAEKAEARERFVREARSVARIRHPNVVDVFDVGLLGDTPYLVMEYLEGESLEAALDRLTAMSASQATTVLLPVAAAIAAVHRAGLIHRDVKPDNVFLARDAKGHVIPKLVDFGIAKDVSAPMMAAHHTVVGTPHYMSPEQARGALTMDARTDQYAFGVMLYQLTTGRLPYDADSLLDLIRSIDEGRAMPPSRLVPELPPEFEQVILRAMARNADERFASMQELGRALLPFASPRLRGLYSTDFGVAAPNSDELEAFSGLADESAFDLLGNGPRTATSTTTTLDRMVRRTSERSTRELGPNSLPPGAEAPVAATGTSEGAARPGRPWALAVAVVAILLGGVVAYVVASGANTPTPTASAAAATPAVRLPVPTQVAAPDVHGSGTAPTAPATLPGSGGVPVEGAAVEDAPSTTATSDANAPGVDTTASDTPMRAPTRRPPTRPSEPPANPAPSAPSPGGIRLTR